jgi:hypothetical protein
MSYVLPAFGALLWAYVAAPLVSRLFGIRTPIPWRERWDALSRLDIRRFVFSYGVLTFGMSGFVFSVVDALSDWARFSEDRQSGWILATISSGWRVLLMFITWLLAGLIIGWQTSKIQKIQSSPDK